MQRRDFLKTCGLGALALTQPAVFTTAQDAPMPNVVFILVDDLGWFDLACYGSTFHETPNLDRLAATGMRFTNGYAASPVCSPTRAAIMTGKHPARVGITDWIPGREPKNPKLLGPQDRHHLPLDEVTLAEAMQQHGYKTFYAGKWHLGSEGHYPEDQGFDINKGGHEKGSPPGGYYAPYKNPKLEDGPEGEYLTDRLTEESLAFMDAHKDDPFFLYLAFYTVHTPIQACKRYLPHFEDKAEKLPPQEGPPAIPEHDGWTRQRQDRPDYASMVYAMDHNVGRVLDKLDELGLTDDTIVVFTSDNGGLATLRHKNAPTANGPLRAGKGWCYEGGTRVPVIIRVPGVTEPGAVSHVPVTSMDYYPTLMALLGADMPNDDTRDGENLAPLLDGSTNTSDRETLFWHYPHNHGSTWRPGAAVRKGDWKLIAFYTWEKVELYNLQEDPGEHHDLSKELPEKTAELQALLEGWQKGIGAKMPQPNPDYAPG
ncbi:MAG: sulfatase [Candidatus Hydrogenedentota bacterium]